MQLNYKTRGKDISPQGKPRVYFCCHPDDFHLFFSSISSEILKEENCAFFYDEKPLETGDFYEWESRLASMQLFVMPVTSKLLKTPNKGLDDYRIAIKHNVPVLPLMQEQGLDNQFNQVCGNLQYLDKHKKDDTAISYGEKLTKFLGNVLVGDQTATKIRDAFRAYMFLSYRKKDRAHAQRLMKLVHKNDDCNDIAIWYDEFLVPGEDFNNAIGDALEKSKLFLLAVTPNLVCEPNYVQAVEYPTAVQNGKCILPVEMQQTDRYLLAQQYPEIPTVVAETDTQLLVEKLLEVFPQKEYGKSVDYDRNYLIALAYLDGIDVEVDNKKALGILNSCANGNHVASIKKLVSMYEVGKGVQRDINQSIYWQNKLVNIYFDALQNSFVEDNCANYAFALWDLGYYHECMHDYDDALKVYRQMQEFCLQSWTKSMPSDQATRLLAKSYCNIGDVFESLLDVTDARKNYFFAMDILQARAEKTQTLDAKMDLYYCVKGVYNCYFTEEKYSEALKYAIKNLQTVKGIVAVENTTKRQNDLLDAYFSVMDVCVRTDERAIANDIAQDMLNLAQRLNDELATEDSKDCLSASYIFLGQMFMAEGKSKDAEICFMQALKLSQEIFQSNPTDGNQYDIALKCEFLALVHNDNNAKLHCKYLHDAYKIYRAQYDMYRAPEVARRLASICGQLSNHYLDTNPSKAKKYLDEEVALTRWLLDVADSLDIVYFSGYTYMHYGYYLHYAEDNVESALEYYQKALEIFEDLYSKNPIIQYFAELSDVHEMLANAYQDLDEYDMQLQHLLKSLDYQSQLAESSNSVDYWVTCSRLALSVGKWYAEEEELEEAMDYFSRAEGICNQLLERSRNNVVLVLYGKVCDALFNFFADQGVISLAKQYAKSCLECDIERAKLTPDENFADTLIVDCLNVANCFIEEDKYLVAIKYLVMAEGYFTQGFADDPQADYQILFKIYQKIVDCYEQEKDGESQVKYLLKQAQAVQKLIADGKSVLSSVTEIYQTIVNLQEDLDKADDAVDTYENCIAYIKSLYRQDDVITVEQLAECYRKYGNFYLRFDDYDSACGLYLEAYDNYEILCELFQAQVSKAEDFVVGEDGVDLASYYHEAMQSKVDVLIHLALCYNQFEDWESTEQCYQLAIDCLNILVEQVGDAKHYYMLGQSYYGHYLCDHPLSLKKSFEIFQQLVEKAPSNANYKDWLDFVKSKMQ